MPRMLNWIVVAFVLVLGETAWAARTQPGSRTNRPSTPQRSSTASKLRVTTSSEAQTLRNLGKAYYEQGKYAEAIEQFQQAIASGRPVATDYLDLGLAQMQTGNYDQALGSFTTAKHMDPDMLATDYNLGILYKREGRDRDAEAALEQVVRKNPGDPASWFNLGAVAMNQRKLEAALEAFDHVLKMGFDRAQNFYVASAFRTYTVLVRLRRTTEAGKYLALHAKYHNRVPGIAIQNVALEGGKYGEVLLPKAAPAIAKEPLPQKVAFTDISSRLGIFQPGSQPLPREPEAIEAGSYSLDFAATHLVSRFGSFVAVADYDGDGRRDVYIVNPAGKNRLLHNNMDGTFADIAESADVAGMKSSVAAAFADYDNSGRLSLFVAGLGGLTLYRNQGGGKFAEETEKAGLRGAAGELATSVIFFDADNDGLLDLFVSVYTDFSKAPQKLSFLFPQDFGGAASHLYRNNGDGTFAEITEAAGLSLVRARARGALFADFNGDGYADLFVLRDDGPPLLHLNQGSAKFVLRRERAFASTALAAQAADFNHDGNFDLVLWTADGFEVLLNRSDATFVLAKNLPQVAAPKGNFFARGLVEDLNGDGFDDLLVADAEHKWHFLANLGTSFREVPFGPALSGDYSSVVSTWLSDAKDLDLLAAGPDGKIEVLRKDGLPSRWLEVRLEGEKSNQLGVGAVVELKAGTFYSRVTVTGTSTRIFTDNLRRLDVVRVTWPNAIVQNAINVSTNARMNVRESERLASSCPLLYAWNGKSYVFVTDVLGASPLGELAPDGSLLVPNPEEYVRVGSNIRPAGGRFVFQFTDEMRETDYFDRARLFAVDHPAAEEIYANEMYGSSPVKPALYVVREKRFPRQAVDDRGRDVLPVLLAADGMYAGGFARARIPGVASLHTLTLDLGSFPESTPVALWLRGWVLWPDSNSARALSSQKTQIVGPSLQVRNPQGEWVTAILEMGLPSGTNRTMRVDLTGKFLSSDHHVRIVTNLCVYWDQIFFTMKESPAPRLTELPLVSADLHYRGFSVPKSDPQHVQPDIFIYEVREAGAPWNPARGNYTRYGLARELLARADDRLVVLAPGDELTVSFHARNLPRLRPGWRRDFFLKLDGWAKDAEPNTLTGQSSEPLPFRAMRNYPPVSRELLSHPAYQEYLRLYQTRPAYALLPPLASMTTPVVGTE